MSYATVTCPVCGGRFIRLSGIGHLREQDMAKHGRMRVHDRGMRGRARITNATMMCNGSGHTVEEASMIAKRAMFSSSPGEL